MDKGIVSFGQHYLENQVLQERLVDCAKLTKKDVVLEIGAGDGRITQKIAHKAGKVIAYEIDEKTKKQLQQIESIYSNVEIKFENFLSASLPKANKIVASLPYQITEPFVEKIKNMQFESIVLLVGKNFGKLVDKENSHEVTKLSLLVECYFDGEYICDVAKDNFNPPPNTMSSIINIFPKEKEKLLKNPALFVMREIFQQRDKKVTNALREGIIRYYANLNQIKTKREVKQILQNEFACVETDCYLEQMNNAQIKDLYNNICKVIK